MAAPTKPKPKPVLENFYSVSEAAIRLGLRDKDDASKKGEKWLRDGVNRHGFPKHRMAGQLKFSDSDLAEIAKRHSDQPHYRTGTRRRSRPAARKPQAIAQLSDAA
ncbi:hypothetical protein OG875_05285 [Streptomyces sp. NBC_01498]|uniref:hypothetical protein n=1 Tax=Streptomyces sp. NBC_01498 TaxID=2975870 RepID=UPI002E7B369A|nr:hypothetical protein [Streptomyces sp. NBC_01498]WTL24072.1 hypothetical protein OG875_05285 [Streptomyces sp. NBC_01498]